MPGLDELLEKHAASPEDLEVCYQLAIRECFEGQYEASLGHAMAILQADREFREDIGRTTMLRIFNLLVKVRNSPPVIGDRCSITCINLGGWHPLASPKRRPDTVCGRGL